MRPHHPDAGQTVSARSTTIAWAFVAAAWAVPAQAEQRFAVVIGNNEGQRGEIVLGYAEDDARRFADTLRTVGGFFPENVVTLTAQKASEVRRVLVATNDRLRDAPDAVLVVYYSGHASSEALHLGGERLPLAELEQIVRGSAARFRVLIVDACRSGALTKVKGGRPVPAYQVSSPPTEGYVVLTAASAEEDALESEGLRSSFFTHFLISGLRGAADKDGDARITLDEAYGYAFDATVLSSSQTVAGTQHPTYRYDLRGKGELVLASLANASLTMVRFDEPIDFLVFDDAMRVVGEVSAAAPNRNLVVPPGALFVRARAADAVYEGTVDVQAEQTRGVTTRELERVPYAQLVRKGTGERAASFAPAVTAGFGYSLTDQFISVVQVAAPVALPSFSVGGSVQFVSSLVPLPTVSRRLYLDFLLANSWDLARATISASSLVGVAGEHGPDGFGVGPAFALAAGVDVPLFSPVFLRAECQGRLGFTLVTTTGGSLTHVAGLCTGGLGASF